MGKFKQKLINFMYGRYGIDELYFALFILWMILSVINIFVGSFIVTIIMTAAAIFMIYRSFSKKHEKRRRENQIFLKAWHPVKNWFKFQRDKFRDRKTSRYRKCPACRAIIKFPYKKGRHTAVCPKCSKKFNVKI